MTSRFELTTLDLFSGSGGLSFGFEKAGFDVVQAIEADENCLLTYTENRKRCNVVHADITKLSPSAALKEGQLNKKDVSIIIGGPPCKGFSESNRRTRSMANPLNSLFQYYFGYIKHIRPKWFVLENVSGVLTLEGGVAFEKILSLGKDLGYKVSWALLNSADFGVPQFRRRIFVVGSLEGVEFEFPRPSHGPKQLPYVSVRQAISDLPKLNPGSSMDLLPYSRVIGLSKYQKLMREKNKNTVQGNLVSRNNDIVLQRYSYIGQGQNWMAIPPELMKNYRESFECHTGIYYRLEYDKPSKVIGNFRKNMLIHPLENRGLSIREAARLQSFPDHYKFVGSIGFQQQQVADAVPPLLSEAIAKQIISYC